MKFFNFLVVIIIINPYIKAQNDTTYFNSFNIISEANAIKVEDENFNLLFKKQFNRPYKYLADVNSDMLDELIIVDSMITNGNVNFTIYLFSGEENFELIDSIYSGSFFPFITYSDEINMLVIETGNPDFERFNLTIEGSSLPINLWKLDNDKLYLVNEELYEPFVFENGNLVQYLDLFAHEKGLNCETSQLYKGIVASVYANYINAGEQSLASNMLKKYYLCDDADRFKQEIIDLLFPKAQE